MNTSVFLLYFNYTDSQGRDRHELQGAFTTLGRAEAAKKQVYEKYVLFAEPLDICYILETTLDKIEL